MKLNTSRIVIALALFIIPITCSIILSATLSIPSAEGNEYVVGGTIIPTNNLLAPWVGAITILALIVAAIYWRGKNVSSM